MSSLEAEDEEELGATEGATPAPAEPRETAAGAAGNLQSARRRLLRNTRILC